MIIGDKLAPIALTAEDHQQLAIALGGPQKFGMLEESEFLAQTGCPPEELENWLENSWSQHNIRAVLAGSEGVGPQPHLLVRYQENQAIVRLFCPMEKLLCENAEEEALASLREHIAGRPWVESCDEVKPPLLSSCVQQASRRTFVRFALRGPSACWPVPSSQKFMFWDGILSRRVPFLAGPPADAPTLFPPA